MDRAVSFNDIMKFHSGNWAAFRELVDKCKNPKTTPIPFVGAGLSAFAYPSWGSALEEMSGGLAQEAEIAKMVENRDYLAAAQALEDALGPDGMKAEMERTFSRDKLEAARDKLDVQAVPLLPHLFRGLVLTTNFDEVLESVYGSENLSVWGPGDQKALYELERESDRRVCGLFKLHGGLREGKMDYDRLVFLERQYDRWYTKGTDLVKTLKKEFDNRILLFLGCSLDKDRTMDVLEEILRPEGPKEAIFNYAIIDCAPGKQEEKAAELKARNIKAILYESGRYESVRVLLEHLLSIVDNPAYRSLPRRVGELNDSRSNPFVYDSGMVDFFGRERELGQLKNFLAEENVRFRWWAVTGPGGMGKSRLAYELKKWAERSANGWTVQYLQTGDYKNLSALGTGLVGSTLLIADYVQQHARELGGWMDTLREAHRSVPLRLLLVERDAADAEGVTAWTKELFVQVTHKEDLRNASYRPDFLNLEPLSGENLHCVMDDFAQNLRLSLGKLPEPLTQGEKEMLLERLNQVDPQMCRPLYALFMVDALVNGNDPSQWDQKEVLNYVRQREEDRVRFSLRQAVRETDLNLEESCLELFRAATICQGLDVKQLQSICPEAWAVVEKKAESFECPEDLLERAGLLNERTGTILPLQPDLMGEYFVLHWAEACEQKPRNQAKRQRLMEAVWQEPYGTAVFLDRIFKDYHWLRQGQWDLLLPGAAPEDGFGLRLYAMVLVNLSNKQDAAGAERTVSRLEKLAAEHKDNAEVVIAYAKGLVNLSNKQDAAAGAKTVARLEALAEEHKGNAEVVVLYAEGLFNLSNAQDVAGRAKTVARLAELEAEHKDNAEVVIEYAKGLVNLSSEQDAAAGAETVSRLEKLAAEHKGNAEVVILYAEGLFNLSAKQDAAAGAETVARLEALAAEHKDNAEVVIACAKGLVNLSAKQDAAGAEQTVSRLEKLAAAHGDKAEVVIEYAKGLGNLFLQSVVEGDIPRAEAALGQLRDVMEEKRPLFARLKETRDLEALAALEGLAQEGEELLKC